MTSSEPQRVPRSPRWVRCGLLTLGLFVAWLGRFCGSWLGRFRTPDRYANGLVIVLPGD